MFLRRPVLLPLLLLLAVAGGALLYGMLSLQQQEVQRREQFTDDASDVLQRIRTQLGMYEYGLRGARGAVIGAGGVAINQQRFGDYVRSRDLPREFPGALGFGFVRRVAEAEVTAFEQDTRRETQAAFQVQQFATHAGERWVLQYFEPVPAPSNALGLDFAADARYRTAALAAMRSGQAMITPAFHWGPAPGVDGHGLWMLLPVYQPGAALETAEARAAATIGWTGCALNLRAALEPVRAHQPDLQLVLRDRDSSDPARVIYQSAPAAALPAKGLQQDAPLTLFGRHWQLQVQALPSYHGHRMGHLPWLAIVIQLALGLLMAAGLHRYLRKQEEVRPLALNQARLTAIMDGTDAAMIGKTPEGTVTSWNRAAEAMFGYSAAEAEGRNIRELVVPAHLFDEQQALGVRVAGGETISGLATQRRHRDGHLLDVDLSLCPVRNELGEIVGVASIVHDVTHLQLVQRAVQELALLTAHSVGTVFLDRAVEALSRVLGAEFVLIGQALDQPTTRVRVLSAVQKGQHRRLWEFDLADTPCEQIYRSDGPHKEQAILIDEPSVIQHELRRRFDTATEAHYQAFLVLPLWDESSHMLGHIGALFTRKVERAQRLYLIEVAGVFARRVEAELQRLLLERQRDEALAQLQALNSSLEQQVNERTRSLEDARRDLRNILDAVPSLIGYWDGNLINRFANKAYGEWFGVEPTAIPGMHVRELLGEATYQVNLPYMQAALAGQAQEFERLLGRRYSLLRYIPDVQAGAVQGFYAVVTDISEIRRAMEAVEGANLAKSAFLANMSHEIRTPMNAILGLLRILERTGLDARQANYLGNIDTAARGLLAILNDILDFSKLEAGRLELEHQLFEIDQLMRRVEVLFSAQVAEKPVETRFEIDPAVPVQVMGDALRLQQVLVNLVGNALKFTERGEVVVSVKLLRAAENFVVLCFAVRDTGIGIAPEALERIFSVFMQAENSTARRFGGTGLGLAISQRLTALMGGELRVQSELGVGSTFSLTLTLPLASAAVAAPPAVPVSHRPRVLLIDDDTEALELISVLAHSLDWEVEQADSSSLGLQKLSAAPPSGETFQAVFVDGSMPAWDDSQAIAALRRAADSDTLPIILMTTAPARDQWRQPATQTGAARIDGFLVKPITASLLQDAMATALAGRRQRQATVAVSMQQGPLRLKGLQILLVEDNAANRLVASELLRAEGAELGIATGGQQAIDLLRQEAARFDLVLMDLQMPGIDGYAATREILAMLAASAPPIVAMTANAMESDRLACLQAGMKDHIGKPFELDRLVQVILRHSRRRPEPDVQPVTSAAPAKPALAVPQIDGIDIAAALARIGGNQALYIDLASNFLVDAPLLMAQAMGEGPLGAGSARVRAVHTLKSLAGTLGLTALATQAAALETTGRAAAASFDADLETFEQALRSANELVRTLLAQLERQNPTAASIAREPLPMAELSALLTLLQTSDGRAIAVFDELSQRYVWADPARQQQINAAIRELDFNTAIAICRSLWHDP